jgi:hypothetical protein
MTLALCESSHDASFLQRSGSNVLPFGYLKEDN